jgi:hypothetical protein
MSKFIQIAQTKFGLFALDDEGNIWQFNFPHGWLKNEQNNNRYYYEK